MKKRYAIVGTGSRSYMYINALCGEYADSSELTAFCDINQTRMDYANENIGKKHSHPPVPTYKPHDFEKMISDNKCDKVIVTSMDRTHHDYIIRGMKAGCDMITEKPMTVDEEKAQAIIDEMEERVKMLKQSYKAAENDYDSLLFELRSLAQKTLKKVEKAESEQSFNIEKKVEEAERIVEEYNEFLIRKKAEVAESREKISSSYQQQEDETEAVEEQQDYPATTPPPHQQSKKGSPGSFFDNID